MPPLGLFGVAMPLENDDPLFKNYVEALRRVIASEVALAARPSLPLPPPQKHDPFTRAALKYLADRRAQAPDAVR